MFTKEKVLEAVKWAIAGRFVAQAITWSISLIVLRYLAPEDYGSYMVSQLIISFLILIAILGVDKVIIQSASISRLQQKQLLFLMLVASWVLAAFLIFFAQNLADFYQFDDLKEKVIFLSFSLILTPWLALSEASLDRELRFKEKSIVNLVVAVICALFTLVLILYGFGIWSLIYSYLLQRVLLCLSYVCLAKPPLMPSFKIQHLNTLGAMGGLFLLGDIVWMLTQSIDGLLGAHWYGVEVYGFFALAAHLSNLVLNKLMPIFNQTLMTFIARMQNDIKQVFAVLSKVINLSLYLTIPIFWGLAIVANNLVATIFGQTWQQSSVIVIILCAFIPLKVVNSLVSMTLLGLGKAKLVLYLRSANLVLLVGLLFFFQTFDFYGLVYAVVISFCMHLVLNTLAIKFVFKKAILPSLKPIIFGFLMVTACFIIDRLIIDNLMALLIQVLFGVVIYTTLMMLLEKETTKEILSWIK